MKAYRFSLESVLEWRTGKEKEVSDRFNRKKLEIEEKNQEIENLKEQYEESKKPDKNHRTAADFMRTQAYRLSLSDKIEEENKALKNLTAELDSIREELIKAKKDKSAMEKLKDKDFDKYKEDINHLEQNFLDEIATLRHTRKEG